MPFVSPGNASLRAGFAKPIVQALFVSSCLLSIVSFYTTEQGMAMYLSPWFSFLAALGVQTSLVMVAWLVGFTRTGRTLLVTVYVITAVISVAFSYVSLHAWFTAKERPALMQRQLYDELNAVAAKTEGVLAEASAKGQRYVLALDEMTKAERTHGHISRAQDADPYLNSIRQAVAREAATYAASYREGGGEGVRYTAFDRYTKLTQKTVEDAERARQAIAAWRAGGARPSTGTEEQLRRFHEVYDATPWGSVEQLLGQKMDRPALPNYAQYVEAASSGQEDLMRAFEELFTAPTARHVMCLLLAAFIDLIVFLLAFSSGPYFYGDPQQRWCAAGAALDASEGQVFVRELLRKVRPGRQGMPRVDAADLTAGEQQVCLLLVSQGLAVAEEQDGRTFYLLDPDSHQSLMETLSVAGLPLRASAAKAAT